MQKNLKIDNSVKAGDGGRRLVSYFEDFAILSLHLLRRVGDFGFGLVQPLEEGIGFRLNGVQINPGVGSKKKKKRKRRKQNVVRLIKNFRPAKSEVKNEMREVLIPCCFVTDLQIIRQCQQLGVVRLCFLCKTSKKIVRTAATNEAAATASHLQDVMEQSDAALVGFSFRELQQGADLETLSVPCVTSLEGTDDYK